MCAKLMSPLAIYKCKHGSLKKVRSSDLDGTPRSARIDDIKGQKVREKMSSPSV